MKYTKPQIIKKNDELPPLTTNFAPPPVEKSENKYPKIDKNNNSSKTKMSLQKK
jgi:hypothetical protein